MPRRAQIVSRLAGVAPGSKVSIVTMRPPQRADGHLGHRGAPVLRRGCEPLNPQDGTPPAPSPVHLATTARLELCPARSALPRERVRSLAQLGPSEKVGSQSASGPSPWVSPRLLVGRTGVP